MWLKAHLPIRRGGRHAACERLSKGFVARVFESRHVHTAAGKSFWHINLLSKLSTRGRNRFDRFLLVLDEAKESRRRPLHVRPQRVSDCIVMGSIPHAD